MIRRSKRLTVAVGGALLYAVSGAVIGASNAGWLAREVESNRLLPGLGIGAGFVVMMFAGTGFSRALKRTAVGRAARGFLIAGPVLYVVGGMIEFAIVGTLAMAIGLFCLTVTVFIDQLGTSADRYLVAVSAVGSITWNTETTSACLLVGVGLVWAVLSVRLTRRLEQGEQNPEEAPAT